MIIDCITNIGMYKNLIVSTIEMMEFYNEVLNDFEKFKPGKYPLGDTKSFFIFLEYNLKNEEDCLWEAHRRFYDVHMILDGVEHIHYAALKNVTQTSEYNDDSDYQLFEGKRDGILSLGKGDFIIFNPNDVHKTGIGDTSTNIKKIVFKVPIIG